MLIFIILLSSWDNPNVFQICTLKTQGESEIRSRQEIGRGLRLCVNQNGERMDESVLGSEVQELNKCSTIFRVSWWGKTPSISAAESNSVAVPCQMPTRSM